MTDTLLFAECLLCWMAANYAFANDPIRGEAPRSPALWWVRISARNLLCVLLLVIAASFAPISIALAACILVGSSLLPWMRRQFVSARWLMEYELLWNGSMAALLWHLAGHKWVADPPIALVSLTRGQTSAACIWVALMIYTVRGGNFLVIGILEKAGGMLKEAKPDAVADKRYAHGRIIGQIERAIVMLVVISGNLEALAFFFAAKGLIRSKELEERARADYFLLGSLASFLIALAAGLVLQHVFAELWK